MAQKKAPYLKVVEPPADSGKPPKKPKKKIRFVRHGSLKQPLVFVILFALAVCGTYLLVKNQVYGQARKASGYESDISDTNNYIQFSDGVIRYNKNGVVFLNNKNEEQWMHPAQIKNPVVEVRKDVFAVADRGGNTILVFSEDGLKGEIETTLPIEQISVSNQGIVSAILKNESSPQIFSYDSAGNILVEHKITLSTTGYPINLEISDDGNLLAVSYLNTQGAVLKSRVMYYNFGEQGKQKTDNIVTSDEYKGSVMAELFFMGNERSVVVGDSSFVIYKGNEVPEKMEEITLDQEIKSVFHSDKYIGFILLNAEKSGYEVRLYDQSGNQVISRAIEGEYRHVKLDGDEILMFDSNRCCIMTVTGITKFLGDIKLDALEMFRARGINKYFVMGTDELRVIYLTK